MDLVIAILVASIAIFGSLFQLFLLFEGLGVLGRFLIPFLPREKLGQFEFWGAWHLAVITLMLNFPKGKMISEMEAFRSDNISQLENLRILATYVLCPLLVSLLISRIHLRAYTR